ncbi:flagellar assembly protein FliH [Chromobacterium sp. IIBBL 290-4]|uniref:flagellar assembly protein FliH n=1 Tax=Chromobacterium sp. IIBBL 290-4 TaxID=2953890 RepID=UPI0020B886CD|nr:flagellar assembly protein FliH [Chromobacterium sp. IIBBL 290-4]UTH73147.1 flagellar assembly protein H [Chromobacterium sp. IIBBL 290-4]
MKQWRTFRFPPLIEGAPLEPMAAAEVQASAADGFRQGMDAGYREGYDSGEAAGRDAGYQAGVALGRAEGMAAARAETLAGLETLGAPLESAIEQLRQLCRDYQAAQRDEVVDLVAKVARQVIRCELALKPAQILDLVEETLAALPQDAHSQGEVEVLLNPEECQRIQELAPERAARWKLIADDALAPGECRVRAASSEADAGCQQRLKHCMDSLREQLQTEPS